MYHAKAITKDFKVNDVAFGDEWDTLEECREACQAWMSPLVEECQILEEGEEGDRLIEIVK